MVQVDIFWSYALGAGFAAASHRQIAASPIRSFWGPLLGDKAATATLLFLSLIFVPSGSTLIWGFTSWETMHVATELPSWLVAAFAVTNVSQGLLGYLVTRWLISRGMIYQGYLHFILGYFAMFFILVHGWDGTGYQRFFSASPTDLANWRWATAAHWFQSEVAIALYIMGAIMIPTMLWMMGRMVQMGRQQAGLDSTQFWVYATAPLGSALIAALGLAILVSIGVHWLGWWPGATLACLGGAWVVRHQRGPLRWLSRLQLGLIHN